MNWCTVNDMRRFFHLQCLWIYVWTWKTKSASRLNSVKFQHTWLPGQTFQNQIENSRYSQTSYANSEHFLHIKSSRVNWALLFKTVRKKNPAMQCLLELVCICDVTRTIKRICPFSSLPTTDRWYDNITAALLVILISSPFPLCHDHHFL